MQEHTTKQKITQTMFQLIAEKGYDKASIGQIAAAIGIQKASVYYYFTSKEDIFLQMVKELYGNDDWDKETVLKEEITVSAYRQELISAGERFIDSYFENQSMRKVYAEIDIQATRIPALQAFVKAMDEKFNQFLTQSMAHGVTIGAFSADFDIKLHAQVLYTILIGIDQAILYDLQIEPKAVWRTSVLALFDRNEREAQ